MQIKEKKPAVSRYCNQSLYAYFSVFYLGKREKLGSRNALDGYMEHRALADL